MYIVLDLVEGKHDCGGGEDGGYLKLENSGTEGEFIDIWFSPDLRKRGTVLGHELLRAVTALYQEPK